MITVYVFVSQYGVALVAFQPGFRHCIGQGVSERIGPISNTFIYLRRQFYLSTVSTRHSVQCEASCKVSCRTHDHVHLLWPSTVEGVFQHG